MIINNIFLFQAILIFNFIDFTPLSYGDYELPGWAQALGWMMACASVLMFPIFAIIIVAYTYFNPEYDGLSLVQVSRDWNLYSRKMFLLTVQSQWYVLVFITRILLQRIIKLTKPTEKWKSGLAKAEERHRMRQGTTAVAPEQYTPASIDATGGKGVPSGYVNPAFDEAQTKF